jgi:hypothetical protein
MKPALVAAIALAAAICFAPWGQAKQGPSDKTAPAQNDNPTASTPSVGDNGATASDQGRNNELPSGDTPAQWILVIVTAITAGFIGWQAWETKRAAKAAATSVEAIDRQAVILERQTAATEKAAEATARSVELAADTAQRQLRAYVGVCAALLKFQYPKHPEAQVSIKNFGQTPAHDVRYWIHTWIAPFPLTDDLPEPDGDFQMSKSLLHPGMESTIVSGEKPPIPKNITPLIGSEMYTVYVYGKITYRDVFGHERSTTYRLKYGGKEGEVRTTTVSGFECGRLQPDREGNEAS